MDEQDGWSDTPGNARKRICLEKSDASTSDNDIAILKKTVIAQEASLNQLKEQFNTMANAFKSLQNQVDANEQLAKMTYELLDLNTRCSDTAREAVDTIKRETEEMELLCKHLQTMRNDN